MYFAVIVQSAREGTDLKVQVGIQKTIDRRHLGLPFYLILSCDDMGMLSRRDVRDV